MSTNPTLYIIDGYAQFFRAYHAIRTPMTSPVTGEPTNMTYGFLGMLLKLIKGQEPRMLEAGGPPTHIAVALDVSGDRGTFRSELYEDYKANRDAPPEDLRPQVDRCLAMLKKMGVPVIGSPGYEADDVIAAITATLKKDHPDLLIRTAGERRISNFLLWQISYAEIHVADVCWPEFRKEHLLAAFRDFGQRERRFGKVLP